MRSTFRVLSIIEIYDDVISLRRKFYCLFDFRILFNCSINTTTQFKPISKGRLPNISLKGLFLLSELTTGRAYANALARILYFISPRTDEDVNGKVLHAISSPFTGYQLDIKEYDIEDQEFP